MIDTILEHNSDLDKFPLITEYIDNLYPLTVTSKIPLYFLEQLSEIQVNDCNLLSELEHYRNRYEHLFYLIKVLNTSLENEGIEYVIFKTIMPFPSVGSDLDVLVFNCSINQVLEGLKKEYVILENVEDNATLYYPKALLKIDLHTKLSVSKFPYLDAQSLHSEIIQKDVEGIPINILSPEAEIIVTLCHSIFKEQMLTLKDYYAILHIFPLCNKDALSSLMHRNQVSFALHIGLYVINFLRASLRGNYFIPQSSKEWWFLQIIGNYEISRLVSSNFHFPHKYSLFSVLIAFMERGLRSRSGIIGVIDIVRLMCKKQFLRRLIFRLPKHFKRTTY